MPDFATWTAEQRARVERALSDWVPVDAPAGLGEAMRYAVLDGGKRVRPLLVLAAAEAVQGHAEAALRAACAHHHVPLHTVSSRHDLLPQLEALL